MVPNSIQPIHPCIAIRQQSYGEWSVELVYTNSKGESKIIPFAVADCQDNAISLGVLLNHLLKNYRGVITEPSQDNMHLNGLNDFCRSWVR